MLIIPAVFLVVWQLLEDCWSENGANDQEIWCHLQKIGQICKTEKTRKIVHFPEMQISATVLRSGADNWKINETRPSSNMYCTQYYAACGHNSVSDSQLTKLAYQLRGYRLRKHCSQEAELRPLFQFLLITFLLSVNM